MRGDGILVLVMLCACAGRSYAQRFDRDTSLFMVPITVSYAYQVPGADMAIRFGNNSNIGCEALVKFRSNYVVGAAGSFLFSDRVREPGLLRGVSNSYGQILDLEGQPATVLLYERGYMLLAEVGRIIRGVGPNPNCGFLLKFGGGYLRHKIRIETQNNEVPQLEGDYVKGYDRLCGGPAAMVFLGYQHIGDRRFVNFQVGFEAVLGFTNSLRAFNFDTRTQNKDKRVDALSGIRVGWTLPVYRRKATSFYFY
ncbi:MAG: hypothetical protein H6597_00400 [Flavobacteriales bacterium]|nr:hypothetical protein [Flavobacteriales bacterium]MCB9192964.1 hypothetical protein [Flavobacteriales bacterium]